MPTVVNTQLPTESFELGRVLAVTQNVRFELPESAVGSPPDAPYVWVSNTDSETFEAAIEDGNQVGFRRVFGDGDRHLYRLDLSAVENWFLNAVNDHDLILRSAVGDVETWWLRFWARDREAFAEFYDSCRDRDVHMSVGRITETDASPETAYGLTDKQRRTILLGLEDGYFDIPKQTSLAELGEKLDISHQAVARRLNRGLRRLVENTLSQQPEQPLDEE